MKRVVNSRITELDRWSFSVIKIHNNNWIPKIVQTDTKLGETNNKKTDEFHEVETGRPRER